MASRFRKKPIEIEAVQFTPLTISECEEFVGGDMGNTPEGYVIATLEGAMHVSVGDWIIKGVQGEFYPCKPDIFEATYESTDKWVLVRDGIADSDEPPIWASQEHPHLFSLDEGETFYDTTEPINNDGTPTIYSTKEHNA